jgi:hypothetical protein
MGGHAADPWRALPRAEKRQYHKTREYLMTKYEEEMDRVRAGGELNLNWMMDELDRFKLAQAQIDAGVLDEENVNEHDEKKMTK